MSTRGKIAVLIENQFDPDQFRRFSEFFPQHGYELEFMTYLTGRAEAHYGSNPKGDDIEQHAVVRKEIAGSDPRDYDAVLCLGAYAVDHLRHQEHPRPGQANHAPAVDFIRRAMRTPGLKVGTICHSLWLMCADPSLLRGRKVTCAHNIMPDVEHAGGDVQVENGETVAYVVDGDLISGKHSQFVEEFMQVFLAELEKQKAAAAAR